MPNNSTVEERVVEMRIDNRKFESGANKTISTLEKLQRALKLKSDTQAVDDLQKSIDKFDTSPMTSGLEKIEAHFSALEVAGLRVIQNLTDSVYRFATRTVKGLTIDQVTAGYNKYEKMIESTQTIMAATQNMIGQSTLEDGTEAVRDMAGAYRDASGALVGFVDEASQMEAVQKYLNGLLWFADETSYSFNDMADNMGKFLSAGVDLESAYTSMMGVASWGATAGAKPAEVSRALYNISQAMGSGAMKNVDWRSIENANMATLGFKQTALDIAKDLGKVQEVISEVTGKEGFVGMGVAVDEAGHVIDMTDEEVEKIMITAKNFRDSLQTGWFDTEVMEEVFARYGKFAERLQTAVGETDIEATGLLEILDKYRKQGDSFWANYARSTNLSAEEVKKLKKEIEELDAVGIEFDFSEQGFRKGQEAKTFTDAIEATKDAVSSRWMTTFQTIFGDYLQAKKFWTQVTSELYDIFAASGDVRNDILSVWAEVDEAGRSGRDYLLGIEYDETGEIAFQGALWNLLDAVKSVTTPIKEAFAEAFGFDDTDAMGESLRDLTKRFQEFTSTLGFNKDAQNGIKTAFKSLFTVLKGGLTVAGKVVSIFTRIAGFAGNLAENLLSVGTTVGRFLKGDLSFDELAGTLQEFYSNIGNSAKEILKSLIPTEDTILYYYDKIKGGWERLKAAFENGVSWDQIRSLLPQFGSLSEKMDEIWNKFQEHYPRIAAKLEEWKNGGLFGTITTGIQSLLSLFGIGKTAIDGTAESMDGLLTLEENFSDNISELSRSVGDESTGLGGVFRKFGEIVSFLFEGLFGDPANIKEKVVTFLDNVWKGVKQWFGKITLGDIFNGVKTAGLMIFLSEVTGILQKLKTATVSFTSILDATKGTIAKAGNLLDDLGKSFRASAYLKIALAIGILAGALLLLAKIPDDRLGHLAATLIMIAGAIAIVSKALGLIIGGDRTKNSNNNNGSFRNITGNKITLFSSLAATLMGLGMVIGAVAGLVLSAKNVPFTRLRDIFFGLIGLLLALTIVVHTMSKMEFASTGGVIGSILAISITLDLLIPLMVVLAALPLDRFLQVTFGVVGLLIALAGAIAIMNKFQIDGGNMLKVVASMGLMALALNALIPIIVLLGAMQPGAFGKAFVSLLGTIVLIGGALISIAAVIKALDMDAGSLIKIAAAFAVFALALDLLIPAFVAFSAVILLAVTGIPWEKLTDRVQAFAKVIGKLAVAGLAIGLLGVGVIILGAGLLVAGAGVLLFAAGVLILVPALMGLKDALPIFINSMIQLSDNAGKMIKGVLVLGALAAIMVLLAKAISVLTKRVGLDKFFSNLGNAIVKGGKTVLTSALTAAKAFGSSISTFLKDNSGKIVQIVGGILTLVGAFLIGIIPKGVDLLIQTLVTLINSFADAIRSNSGYILHAVTNALEALMEILIDGLAFIIGALGKVILDMVNGLIMMFTNTIIDSLKNGGFWVDIASFLGIDVDGMINSLEGLNQHLADAGSGFAADMNANAQILKDWANETFISPDAEFVPAKPAEEAVERMNAMRDAGLEDVSAIQELNTTSLNTEQFTTAAGERTEAVETEKNSILELNAMRNALENSGIDFGKYGIDISQLSDVDVGSLFSGITTKVQEGAGGIPAASGAGVLEHISDYESALEQMANDGALSMFKASKDSDYPNAAGDTLGYNAAKGADDAADKNMPAVGLNTALGLADQIVANKHYAYNAGQALGAAAAEGTRDYLGVRSPSRLMMQIGGYTVTGFINGLQQEQSGLFSEGESLGSTLTNAVLRAMANVALLASDDFDISPVITPVVDMTGVDAAAGSINGAFANSRVGLSADLTNSVSRRLSQAERIAASEASRASVVNSNDVYNINIYPSEGMDENALADAVMARMQSRMVRRSAAFG